MPDDHQTLAPEDVWVHRLPVLRADPDELCSADTPPKRTASASVPYLASHSIPGWVIMRHLGSVPYFSSRLPLSIFRTSRPLAEAQAPASFEGVVVEVMVAFDDAP